MSGAVDHAGNREVAQRSTGRHGVEGVAGEERDRGFGIVIELQAFLTRIDDVRLVDLEPPLAAVGGLYRQLVTGPQIPEKREMSVAMTRQHRVACADRRTSIDVAGTEREAAA